MARSDNTTPKRVRLQRDGITDIFFGVDRLPDGSVGTTQISQRIERPGPARRDRTQHLEMRQQRRSRRHGDKQALRRSDWEGYSDPRHPQRLFADQS